MSVESRQKQFIEAVKADPAWTPQSNLRSLFGISNSARIIEEGLFIGTVNFERGFSAGTEQVVFTCQMTLPPQDEVFFAVFVKNEFSLLAKRLGGMLEAAGPGATAEASQAAGEEAFEPETLAAGAIPYSPKNNNVRFYLADDGRLYMRNKDYWTSMNFSRESVGPAPFVDKIVFSIYPPAPSARRSLLAREFVGYLGHLIGPEKVHEAEVWQDETAITDDMRRMPSTIPIHAIETAIEAMGGFYPGGEVRRFHAALNFLRQKHFVILSGLSGTGKTQLALKYARAVHGVGDNGKDPLLFTCPVRPEWTDPTGLTGYYDVLSNKYIVPTFLEAVLVATAHNRSPVFVVLDEMNLARVEYYFSDVLSCIETCNDLSLHSNSVPLEGTTGTSIRAELPFPENLFIIGTVNVDETTTPISNKVLDRASIIDMSSVDIPGFVGSLQLRVSDLASACNACSEILTNTHNLLSPHGLGFGYRVAEEFVRYFAFATGQMGDDATDVIDALMIQKVLPKLRGSERQRSLLTALLTSLAGYPSTVGFLKKLTEDLDEFGSFQASR